MEYTIIHGQPSPDEVIAIEHAMSLHKRQELVPVIRKSSFGLPQLRRPLHENFRFGRRT